MINKTIEQKVNKMNQFDSRQKFVNLIFYAILIFYILSLLFFALIIGYAYYLLENKYDVVYMFNVFLLIIIILVYLLYFLESTPLILIPLISYKRTNYTGFLFETLIELQFVFFAYIIITIQMFVAIPIFQFLTFVPIFIVLGYQFLKKPVVQGWIGDAPNKFTRTGVLDIVENQTLHVNDFQDGYSSRPIFDSLTDIFDESYSKQEIFIILSSFAKFIAINGDLISFDIQKNIIKLYFRTALIQRTNLINFFLQFKYLKKIIQKQDLTCITFNLEPMEINFKLNEIDYEKLGYVTFNKLSTKIIDRFKAGLTQFLNKNYGSVYVIINPKEDGRSFKYYHKRMKYIY